jgi:septal ring factor EnvC (AmiA/AmiB activator)
MITNSKNDHVARSTCDQYKEALLELRSDYEILTNHQHELKDMCNELEDELNDVINENQNLHAELIEYQNHDNNDKAMIALIALMIGFFIGYVLKGATL